MHTRVDILLCSQKSEEELLSVAERIHEALSCLEKTANYYDPASELAVASVSPVVLSSQLYAMVDLCLEYHEKTSGCFDVTVHSENYNQDTIHSVCLSAEEQSIFYRQPGITINLSGFLKGYALETIRDILHSCSIENALINMGNSSVLALGHHPLADGWKVGFGQGAVPNGRKPQELLLQNECLTTSGNDSHERKHIINPRNGKPVEGKREVAVVTDNGAIGEVLSTGLFVADARQREILEAEFRPRLILDL